jgi:hypothetical protein
MKKNFGVAHGAVGLRQSADKIRADVLGGGQSTLFDASML